MASGKTVPELLRALTAYTEHRAQCPSVHGWRVDERGVRIPCACGLDDLLAEARALIESSRTDSQKG